MEKVSIIVPVYNVSEYLEECLDSIVKQTYKNLKIIIVDDCSTDESGKICDRYLVDPRVTVLHLPHNVGLSGARNAGLKIVDTEYVTFVDSDDYILPNHIEKMYNCIYDFKADIAISDYVKFGKTCQNEYKHSMQIDEKVIKTEKALKFLCFDIIQSFACNKLYKTKLFENIGFPERKCYEDMLIMYPLIKKSNAVCFTNSATAYFRMRGTSISHAKEHKIDYFNALIARCNLVKSESLFSKELREEINVKLKEFCLSSAYVILYIDKLEKYGYNVEEVKRYWQLNKNSKEIKNKNLILKTKFPWGCSVISRLKKKAQNDKF